MSRHRVKGAPERVWAVVEVAKDGNYNNYRLYSKLSTARMVRTQSQRYSSGRVEFIILETVNPEWKEVE